MNSNKKPIAKPDWKLILDNALLRKFGVKFVTEFNLFAGWDGAHVTRREDKKRLKKEHRLFIDGFMECLSHTGAE
jgi:hypothetical protein